VHSTVPKTYRHLNFFQHECHLQVRTPRVKLPNGSVRMVEPDFVGRLSGFTLLFEALILMLAQQMPFAAVARIVGASAYRVLAVCERYVHVALGLTDFSQAKALAIDETSRSRGHDYITLAADALERRVLFVTEARDADTIKALAVHRDDHEMRRIEQRTDKSLKGMRWSLLKNRCSLKPDAVADLDALSAKMTTVRTARAWFSKERLREILVRKQINVVRAMLGHWCTCVMRSKVEPMKGVAALERRHIDGIVAWALRQTNGFLEASNGLFQAAKRRARGFVRLSTIKTVTFLISGKLDFNAINPHAR
jgi:transposase